MDSKLEKFLREYTTPEDPVLEDLYRQTHLRFVNPNMVSGHEQGKLLNMLSRMINPETILEIGTFTGYSAICLARGLKKGGTLLTIELNDELSAFAAGYFRKAGVAECIRQYTGRAQDIIPDLKTNFDLVFIDGDKREYCEYFRLVRNRVRRGGFIIADNVFWGGKIFEKSTRDPQTLGIIEFNKMIKNEPGLENLVLPLRDGLMIIRIV